MHPNSYSNQWLPAVGPISCPNWAHRELFATVSWKQTGNNVNVHRFIFCHHSTSSSEPGDNVAISTIFVGITTISEEPCDRLGAHAAPCLSPLEAPGHKWSGALHFHNKRLWKIDGWQWLQYCKYFTSELLNRITLFKLNSQMWSLYVFLYYFELKSCCLGRRRDGWDVSGAFMRTKHSQWANHISTKGSDASVFIFWEQTGCSAWW